MFSGVEKRQIAVFGLGYVGCVTAACLARLGHRVFGIDKDASKVASVMAAKAPFYEPGLEEVIGDAVAAGLLTAGVDAEPALKDADIALFCVGTPLPGMATSPRNSWSDRSAESANSFVDGPGR